MKKSVKLVILLCVLLLLIVTTVLIKRAETNSAIRDPIRSVSIIDFDPDSIHAFTLEYDGEVNPFVSDGQGWYCTDIPDLPIHQPYITAILKDLATLTSVKWIDEPGDLAQYGLDAPWCRLTVVSGDQQLQVIFGDETGIGNKLYVSAPDGKVYLVSPSQCSAFKYRLLELAELEAIPAMNSVESVSLTSENQDIQLDYREEAWYVRVDGEHLLAEPLGAEALVSAITGAVFSQCVAFRPSPDVEALYGFDGAQLTATVHYDGGCAHVLELSRDGRYGRIFGSDRIYTIDSSAVSMLGDLTSQDFIKAE